MDKYPKMDEYSIDEIKEEKAKEGLEYKTVGSYTINIISNEGSIPYEIETITSLGLKEVGWTPGSDIGSMLTQNFNLKNLKNNNKSKKVMCKIIQDVYMKQTKEEVGSELILERHESLVEKMLADYRAYYKKQSKK